MQNFDQLSMLQVLKLNKSKKYKLYCDLKERYSLKNFDLNNNGKVSKAEFERVLLEVTSKTVRGHEWTHELTEMLWRLLLKEDDGDGCLSRKEFSRIRSLVASHNGQLVVGHHLSAPHPETDGRPMNLQEELKEAALRVVKTWVDEDSLDKKYGVDDDTALITAASQGEDAVTELLLDAGADLEVCNNKGLNAVASAAYAGMDDCLEILLTAAEERGMDLKTLLEQKNGRGETPLLLACVNGWTDCARVLIQKGADLMTIR